MSFYRNLACAGASLLTIAASSAFAQATPAQTSPDANVAEGTGDLSPNNEIIVSARRRAESVQDVPQTVNVVTAAQIDKLNLRNFTDISSVVPGLQMQAASAFSNTATVRGIAFDPGASGNNPSVEFYLNDAPISSGFLFQSTYDLGQFELQRGPQGTLRGRASPSGSIAVTTHRPDLSEPGAVANGTITTQNARKLDAALNIPIIRDVLAIRVAGVLEGTDGNHVNSISEAANPQFTRGPSRNTRSYRISGRFEPADWLAINVMYQNMHTQDHSFEQVVSESLISGAAPAGTIIRPFDRLAIDEQGSYSRQDYQVLTGNIDIRFAGQKLSYTGSYNKQDFGILGPQDSANFYVGTATRNPTDLTGFDQVCLNERNSQSAVLNNGAYDQCTHSSGSRNSHEIRLASEERIGGIFDYVVGGFYDHNNNPTNLTQETPLLFPAPGGGAVTPPIVLFSNLTSILRRGTSTEKSAFANLTAHFYDDKLELSGGLRYIDYQNQNSLFITGRAPAANVVCGEYTNVATPCTVTSDAQRTHATIYTASAKYRITPDIMVYALTGSSWRPGPRAVGNFSLGPVGVGQTARELAFENLPPETSKSYEIGMKASFNNNSGRFNVSLYHQTFKNYPFAGPLVYYVSTSSTNLTPGVSSANNPGGFGFLSPVPVTVNGAEVELSYQLLDRWSLGVNAAYADGKIKNATIACTDINGDGIPDVNPARPTVAQLQAAVGAGQAFSVCNGVNRRSNVTPKFSANIQSEYGFEISGSTDGFVRGLYSYFGRTQGSPDNPFDDVPGYGLLNIYAGIRDKQGRWELTAFAKNLTQEQKILTVAGSTATTTYTTLNPTTFASGAGSSSAPYRVVTVTAPREFGISARMAIGSR